MILATGEPFGGPIKLRGIAFYIKLSMRVAVRKCAIKAAWKSKSLLRCRRFCNVIDLIMLFKAHILSYIEYRTAGVHCSCSSVLAELDDVQSRFISQFDLSEESAFMSFNMAPCVLSVTSACSESPTELLCVKGLLLFQSDISVGLRRSDRTCRKHSTC